MSVSDRQLLALLSGALEPVETARVEAAVGASAVLQARLAVLRLEWSRGTRRSFRVPPVGMRMGATSFVPRGIPLQTLGTISPGSSFRILLEGDVDLDAVVVVLQHRAREWTVVAPVEADEEVRVGELPRVDGVPYVPVTAGAERGRQRWAVALVGTIDWADPWAQLQQDLRDDTANIRSLVIEVA